MPKIIQRALNYPVGSKTSIDVAVVVGDFQPGAVGVVWGKPHSLPSGDTLTLAMDGAPLAGEQLVLVASITGGNKQNLRTSITVELTGGTAPMKRVFQHTVDQSGGLVVYFVTVELVP